MEGMEPGGWHASGLQAGWGSLEGGPGWQRMLSYNQTGQRFIPIKA